MDFEFDDLKKEFLAEADAKVKEIGDVLRVATPASSESLERTMYLAHQLKGAGGSYGFQSISTDAAALESALENLAKGNSTEANYEISRRLSSLAAEIEWRSRELASRPTSP